MKQRPKPTIILLTAVIMAFCALCSISCTKEFIHVGPNWNAVHNMTPEKDSFYVKASGRQKAKLGEELTFSIKSEKTGKLWIVQVDPEDDTSIIFPNEEMKDNRISAKKTLSVPPEDAKWSIIAQEPKGRSVLAFIVTLGDTDIEDILSQAREESSKSLGIGKKSGWSVKKLVVDIE